MMNKITFDDIYGQRRITIDFDNDWFEIYKDINLGWCVNGERSDYTRFSARISEATKNMIERRKNSYFHMYG